MMRYVLIHNDSILFCSDRDTVLSEFRKKSGIHTNTLPISINLGNSKMISVLEKDNIDLTSIPMYIVYENMTIKDILFNIDKLNSKCKEIKTITEITEKTTYYMAKSEYTVNNGTLDEIFESDKIHCENFLYSICQHNISTNIEYLLRLDKTGLYNYIRLFFYVFMLEMQNVAFNPPSVRNSLISTVLYCVSNRGTSIPSDENFKKALRQFYDEHGGEDVVVNIVNFIKLIIETLSDVVSEHSNVRDIRPEIEMEEPYEECVQDTQYNEF